MHFNFFQLFYKNNWNDFCHFSLKDKTFGMQVFLDLNKYNQLLPYFKILVTLCRTVEFSKPLKIIKPQKQSCLGPVGIEGLFILKMLATFELLHKF